jgi:3-mercaptopyruvate sulfurtransferase SseA
LGDIPGVRWGRSGNGRDADSMSDHQLMDGTFRPTADITAFWRAEGNEKYLEITIYCGADWRASLAFFYAWLMDWERISVFDGGWFK